VAVTETAAQEAPAHTRRTASPRGSYVRTLGGSVAVLSLNLLTGILVARLLGPDGRGAVGAIAGWIVMLAFVGGLGFRDGLVYVHSRERASPPTVLGWGVASVAVLGTPTVLVAIALVPLGFGAQDDDTARLAMLFMLAIVPQLAWNTFGSLLAAHHHFGAQTVQRVAQPLLYALALGALWAIDALRPGAVLAALTLSHVITAAFAFVVLLREGGISRPERAAGRDAWSFGIRAYPNTLGVLTNARLDVLVMPAVVATGEIGLYVVAVSIASMMSGVFGSVDGAVFALAARLDRDAAAELAVRTTRLVLAASLACALALFVVAPPLISLVYGDDFAAAVPSLRLLLPGMVLWSAASIVGCGLKALGRPGSASVAQGAGAVVTVAGLLLLLGPLGIEGAALTSSIAYGVVFSVAAILLARDSAARTWQVVDLRHLAEDARWLLRRQADASDVTQPGDARLPAG
jgi:O-antigen/teichoic acid export membrane protein